MQNLCKGLPLSKFNDRVYMIRHHHDTYPFLAVLRFEQSNVLKIIDAIVRSIRIFCRWCVQMTMW